MPPDGPTTVHSPARSDPLSIQDAAALPADRVLALLDSRPAGLTTSEVTERTAIYGPNAVRSHHAGAWSVLARQIRSPLLWLLGAAAAVSAFVGEGVDALIIGVILGASVGLGFVNEFRAERAAEAMHSDIRHLVTTTRDGIADRVEVTHLVPGDVVHLEVGSIVPADLRLLTATYLECDESVLTGESAPAVKSAAPVAEGKPLAELASCAFLGTVVHEGSADAVVVVTGRDTQFGRIAIGLGEKHPQTEFQIGLTRFSGLLARVGGILSLAIFVVNILLGRPFIDAVLFSLAVAVGITPQLLPAVVSTSLATGSRRLAERKVLVKRLVCIEDLGDIDVLFTDKTGTLTEGRITFARAIDVAGGDDPNIFELGLVCNEAAVAGHTAVGGNSLDAALWDAPGSAEVSVDHFRRIGMAPFDHDRQCASVLVDDPSNDRVIITKGAPETILDRCRNVTDEARTVLEREFAAGNRVVAIATRPGHWSDLGGSGGRARPGPGRVLGLPRPAEAVGSRVDRSSCRARDLGQGGHR